MKVFQVKYIEKGKPNILQAKVVLAEDYTPAKEIFKSHVDDYERITSIHEIASECLTEKKEIILIDKTDPENSNLFEEEQEVESARMEKIK